MGGWWWGGGLLISLVTREEHKSTHSIRDFISRPASVKVKCWRISPGSIIVCNFTYGPPPPVVTPLMVTNENTTGGLWDFAASI